MRIESSEYNRFLNSLQQQRKNLERQAVVLRFTEKMLEFAENTDKRLLALLLLPFSIAGCSKESQISTQEKTTSQAEGIIEKPKTISDVKLQATTRIKKIFLSDIVGKNGGFNTDGYFYIKRKTSSINFFGNANRSDIGFAMELNEQISGKLVFDYRTYYMNSEVEAPINVQFIHAKDFNDYSQDTILKEDVLYPKKEEQKAEITIPEGTNKIVFMKVGPGPAGISVNRIFVVKEIIDDNNK